MMNNEIERRIAEIARDVAVGDEWDMKVARTAIRAALADPLLRADVREMALEQGYLLGFDASREGYNAEYPFADKGNDPSADEEWLAKRAAAIRAMRE